ncbi:hypothetical protein MMC11_007765 [Xylographa trunciseda]|nr:hypothetical protein [Xylographa trunciseda]
MHEAEAAKIEGWGGGVGKVVVADWDQALGDVWERDFERGWRDLVEDGRVDAGKASGVVQRCQGTDCDGDGSGSRRERPEVTAGSGVVAAGWTGVPQEAAEGFLVVFGTRFLKLGKSLGAPKFIGEADTKQQKAETRRRVERMIAMKTANSEDVGLQWEWSEKAGKVEASQIELQGGR